MSLVILSSCLSACLPSPSRPARDRFRKTNYCYSTERAVFDHSQIQKDGYYTFTFTGTVFLRTRPRETAYSVNCLFFKDGTFIYHYSPEYLSDRSEAKFGFYNRGTYWGTYNMVGDTIKTQFIESPGGMSWSVGQIWFRIINPDRLQWLALKYSKNISVQDIALYQSTPGRLKVSDGVFVAADQLPDPNKSWLKRKSWFWCSEEEYMRWKKVSKKR